MSNEYKKQLNSEELAALVAQGHVVPFIPSGKPRIVSLEELGLTYSNQMVDAQQVAMGKDGRMQVRNNLGPTAIGEIPAIYHKDPRYTIYIIKPLRVFE